MNDKIKWSRRKLLATGATLAVGGVALEALSLRGTFDSWRLPNIAAASNFADQLLRLDALDNGGVIHLGQSTHLLALGGLRVLTDPWFFDPAFGSLTHSQPLPVSPQALGPLDVIAITHDHPDHADRKALDRLDKNALVIAGAASLVSPLRKLGFKSVEHVATWKELSLGPLRVTATPALHDVPEAGFVFAVGEQSVYFAGDTATHSGLPEIAERFRLQLAILPIDGTRIVWEPRLVMDPSDAADATALLKPRMVMSSHADAVQSDPIARHLLSESAATPHATFKRLIGERAPDVTCVTPTPGELVAIS